MEKRLYEMAAGDTAVVIHSRHTENAMARRLYELGFWNGTDVRCVGESPFGGMKAYLVKGSVIALRDKDAAGISIEVRSQGREL